MTDFDEWAKGASAAAEREDLEESLVIRRLKAQLADAKRMRRAAEHRADMSEQQLDHFLALKEAQPEHPAVIPLGHRKKSRTRACPMIHLSDWHVEEVVDPETVNGRNEFNPDIAKRRVEYLTDGIIWTIDNWRGGWDIHRAVVNVGGDMISGYIHDELQESNALSPTEASLLAQELLTELLRNVLDGGREPLEQLDVVCNFGNHGRTQAKPRVSTAAKNSFEWLMYQNLAQRFENESRVTFTIANGAHVYGTVFGKRIRYHHGDHVRYQGGVGGLSIPLRKACDAWDTFEKADHTMIGHWHQFLDLGYAIVNGSLIGFNAYALSIKARYEPPRQGMFLIDEDWGKKMVTPVYCDPDRKAK